MVVPPILWRMILDGCPVGLLKSIKMQVELSEIPLAGAPVVMVASFTAKVRRQSQGTRCT